MEKVFAMELQKPAALGVLSRTSRFDTSSFTRRDAEAKQQPGAPVWRHQFSRVQITQTTPAVLYEENLAGQPGPDTEGSSEPVPLDISPTTGSVTGGTQTGETGCDTATGRAFSSTLNNNECTKDCSTKHEAKHAADIAPCCTKAGEAAKAAKSDAEKADIQTKFDNWMVSNRPFLECRAYDISVSCGEAKYKKLNCEKETSKKCCKDLVWYIRTSTLERQAACNNAGQKLSDCPFS